MKLGRHARASAEMHRMDTYVFFSRTVNEMQ